MLSIPGHDAAALQGSRHRSPSEPEAVAKKDRFKKAKRRGATLQTKILENLAITHRAREFSTRTAPPLFGHTAETWRGAPACAKS